MPLLHYVAPRSLLVFDHVSRSIALLHAGTETERAALRREVVAALRGACRASPRAGRYQQPTPVDDPRGRTSRACSAPRNTSPRATSTSWCWRRGSAGRHELDPFQAYRALRLINPSPYMYFCALGDITVVGSSPEALVQAQWRARAQLRPIAGTRPRS